jgi:hypothetical protein
MQDKINLFVIDRFIEEVDIMLGDYIDPRLALLDRVFGEDDNHPVPTEAEIYSPGNRHIMIHAVYTCEQLIVHVLTDLDKLYDEYGELMEAGAEINMIGPDGYESEAEWQAELDEISKQIDAVNARIEEVTLSLPVPF